MQSREQLVAHFEQVLHEHIQCVNQRNRSLVEQTGLTVPQAKVIEALIGFPEGCSMNTLSHRVGQSCASLTGLVDRLVKVGLVSRVPDIHDRRVVLVSLTAEGRVCVNELERLRKSSFVNDLQDFTAEELLQFASLLQKFSQRIQQGITVESAGKQGTAV